MTDYIQHGDGTVTVVPSKGQTGSSDPLVQAQINQQPAVPAPPTPSSNNQNTYTDSSGNVHLVQDFSAGGGGKYNTVIGGFYGGYEGSGFQRQAASELSSPSIQKQAPFSGDIQRGTSEAIRGGYMSYGGLSSQQGAEKYFADVSAYRAAQEQQAAQRPQTQEMGIIPSGAVAGISGLFQKPFLESHGEYSVQKDVSGIATGATPEKGYVWHEVRGDVPLSVATLPLIFQNFDKDVGKFISPYLPSREDTARMRLEDIRNDTSLSWGETGAFGIPGARASGSNFSTGKSLMAGAIEDFRASPTKTFAWVGIGAGVSLMTGGLPEWASLGIPVASKLPVIGSYITPLNVAGGAMLASFGLGVNAEVNAPVYTGMGKPVITGTKTIKTEGEGEKLETTWSQFPQYRPPTREEIDYRIGGYIPSTMAMIGGGYLGAKGFPEVSIKTTTKPATEPTYEVLTGFKQDVIASDIGTPRAYSNLKTEILSQEEAFGLPSIAGATKAEIGMKYEKTGTAVIDPFNMGRHTEQFGVETPATFFERTKGTGSFVVERGAKGWELKNINLGKPEPIDASNVLGYSMKQTQGGTINIFEGKKVTPEYVGKNPETPFGLQTTEASVRGRSTGIIDIDTGIEITGIKAGKPQMTNEQGFNKAFEREPFGYLKVEKASNKPIIEELYQSIIGDNPQWKTWTKSNIISEPIGESIINNGLFGVAVASASTQGKQPQQDLKPSDYAKLKDDLFKKQGRNALEERLSGEGDLQTVLLGKGKPTYGEGTSGIIIDINKGSAAKTTRNIGVSWGGGTTPKLMFAGADFKEDALIKNMRTNIVDVQPEMRLITGQRQPQALWNPTDVAQTPMVGIREVVIPGLATPQLTQLDIAQATRMEAGTGFDRITTPEWGIPKIPFPALSGGAGGGNDKRRWRRYFQTTRYAPILPPDFGLGILFSEPKKKHRKARKK